MASMTRREILQSGAAAAVTGHAASAVGAAIDAPKQLYTRSPIEIYTDRLSVLPGEKVALHVSTTARKFDLEIARIGKDETVAWSRKGLRGAFYPTPEDAAQNGCGWPVAFQLKVPSTWRSGYYQIKAVTAEEGVPPREFLAFLVVRARQPTARILMVLSTATYAAYNNYGGACLYLKKGFFDGRPISGTNRRVSNLRPWMPGFLSKPRDYDVDAQVAATGGGDFGGKAIRENFDVTDNRIINRRTGMSWHSVAAGFHNWESVMVRWLEQRGYAVDYAVSSDLEFQPDLIGCYRLMLSVGHDEYWSWGMRDAVETFVSRGGNVCFFSGNISTWQVRYEERGSAMVCYKNEYRDDPYFSGSHKRLATGPWICPEIDRPETRLTGLSTMYGGFADFFTGTPKGSGGYDLYRPGHWMFENTGLNYGDCIGRASRIVHYEVDGCPIRMENGVPHTADFYDGPKSLEILAMAPAGLPRTSDSEEWALKAFGDTNPAARQYVSANRGHACMSIYNSNGTVFCAGTTDWTSGLTGKDPAVEQITANLIDRLST